VRQLGFVLAALAGAAFLACGSGGGGDDELFTDEGSGGSNEALGGATAEVGGSSTDVGGSSEQTGGFANPTGTGGSSNETGAGGSPGMGGGQQGPVADPACTGAADFVACSLTTTPDRSFDICAHGLCASPGCGLRGCNVPAVYFSLPGDTRSEFTRTAGDEPVVTDGLTGLMWQGCAAGLFGDACSEGSPELLTYDDSVLFCEELAWGGLDDWRMPTIRELVSIISFAPDAHDHEQIDRQFAFVTDLRSSTPSTLYGGHWQLRLHGVDMDTAQDTLELQVVCVR